LPVDGARNLPGERLFWKETFSNMRPPLKHLEATMLFSRFAQFAAALTLLATGLAAPAHAQNNKQIISGTWYEDRANASNSANNQLILTFTQTPASQFLNITNIACSITVLPSEGVGTMYLVAGTTSGQGDLDRPYAIKGNATPETVGTSKYYSIVNQVFFKFGPGRFPSIVVNTASSGSSATSADCVIVGNLTDN
jgi:hypothetical protein